MNCKAYKGFYVVPLATAEDEMGCRAIARMSNPEFMDGVPAGLEPMRRVADRTDWRAILEYEDEGRSSVDEASSNNLKSLVRDALAMLGLDVNYRSIRAASWRRRALAVTGPMLKQVKDHAA